MRSILLTLNASEVGRFFYFHSPSLDARVHTKGGTPSMGRKASFTKEQYEALPDDLKGLLKLNGDAYEFEFETTDDVAGLKSALDSERKAAKTHADALKAYDGVDAQEARALLASKKKLEEDALKAAGKWDDMKAQMRKEFEDKELNPAKAEAVKYKTAAEKFLAQDQFRAAVGKLSPKKGAADVLLPHALGKIRIVEENGELVARIFDGDVLRIDGKGNPVSFEDFAEKDFRQSEVFGHLFEPSGAAGSGAPSSQAGGASGKKTMKRADFDALAPQGKAEFVNSGGVPVD